MLTIRRWEVVMTIDPTNNPVSNETLDTVSKTMQKSNHKKLLLITLATAALTLSACGKKDTPVTEGEPAVDAQTSAEQVETGVASADDVAVASADEGLAVDTDADLMDSDVGVASADDVAVDDSEVMDGSETEEHISTY